MRQSIQQFFTAVNWDDQPLEIQHLRIAGSQEEFQELSLFLSVNQFFSAFNWDGNAAAPLKPAQPSEKLTDSADHFTLDDFSDLF
ncbi:MAG: hypothetical protein ACKO7W_05030 [Elainella sp.]